MSRPRPGSVLYFGDPQGALALLERGVHLAGVVHGRRGGPGARRLAPLLAGTPRWRSPDLRDAEVCRELAAVTPSLLVAGFYPRQISAQVLDLARGINVHPSDLPRWRGPDPTHWAIRSGDTTTAICVHLLTEGLDEGDVLLREVVSIGSRESAGHLAARLEARGAQLLADVAVRLLAGEDIPRSPQQGDPTWAPMVPGESLEIDWTRPAEEVDRFVRAATPEPGAYTGIGGELLVVLAGCPVDAGGFSVLSPATPYVRNGQTFVRCAEGALRLDRVVLGRRRLGGRQLASLLS